MYNPTYNRDKMGQFDPEKSIASIFAGTDAYLMEDEMNELQWIQNEARANILRKLAQSGHHVKGSLEAQIFTTLNSFIIGRQEVLINGYDLVITKNSSSDSKNTIQLSSPPASGTRKDLVFLEAWFEELNSSSSVYYYGGVQSGVKSNTILDSRLGVESSRRVQLRWRIRVVDGVDTSLHADGISDTGKVFAWGSHATNSSYNFVKSTTDPSLYFAGSGSSTDKSILGTANGYVYAIQLFIVSRYNSATYDVSTNTNGAPLYVDGSSTSSRSDGRFSNVIYLDQIQDDRYQSETKFLKYFSDSTGALILNKNLYLNGDFIVTGTVTNINTTNLNVSDNYILLNSNFSGSSPTLNAGIEIERGAQNNVDLIWNETVDRWQATMDGTNYYDLLLSNQKGVANGLASLDNSGKVVASQLPVIDSTATLIVDQAGNGNYTTIQAAIDQLTNGGLIIVKDGTYTENIVLASNITIMGMGYTTKITGAVSIPDAIIKGTSINNVRITNLVIQYVGGSTGNGNCISLYSCSYITIDNCWLTGAKTHCTYLESCKTSSVRENRISGAGTAGVFDEGDITAGGLDGNEITSNKIEICAVGIQLETNAHYDVATNNILRTCTTNIINSGSNNTVTNNVFRP